MPLESGSRLGGYEVLTLVGRGGMGEVYRARDLKLNRDVAIKVLPDHLARDDERLARLRREAHVLAALNHPHIAQIHGLEDSNGVPALVLELVEGPTLADRIAAGPLQIREALVIARQIADALEAAHDKAVIHRDLKPANIKLTPSGAVKVLDFGLAKALAGDASGADLSLVTTEATHEGMVVGTAAYMSPEQARGQSVDRRTDVWAFGCVLFEMLTGRRAFARRYVVRYARLGIDERAGLDRGAGSGSRECHTADPALSREGSETPIPRYRRRAHRDRGRRRRAGARPRRRSPANRVVSRRTAIGTLAGAAAGAAAMGAFAFGRDRNAAAP